MTPTAPVLADLVDAAAAAAPDIAAVLDRGGAVTWQQVAERTGALAGGLRARGIERFAAVLTEPADVLAVLAGASRAGCDVCLYPPDADDEERRSLARRFDHRTVVSDTTGVPGATVVTVEDLAAAGDGSTTPASPASTLLVLTTGTTGERKGACHRWDRLVAGVRHRRRTAGTRWLGGYDLHQFAGLQLLLHVVASHSTLVPGAGRPMDAPALVRDLSVTHASATPTYWRFFLAALEGAAELPLQQITLGGEAVPARLLEDLARSFPRARVSQVYASTEFGSSVSVRDHSAGLPRSVLERGDDADVRFRIEDGELWARSRVGMVGYHGEEADGDGWRPTGDLVEVVGDRIRFVGRTHERINVGGVKVHPLPIEEVVAAVPGVRLARVYGRENPLTGHIVAADVVVEPGVETAAVEAQIREACSSLPRASRPRTIRVVPELEVHGGKLSRRTPAER